MKIAAVGALMGSPSTPFANLDLVLSICWITLAVNGLVAMVCLMPPSTDWASTISFLVGVSLLCRIARAFCSTLVVVAWAWVVFLCGMRAGVAGAKEGVFLSCMFTPRNLNGIVGGICFGCCPKSLIVALVWSD